MRKKAVQELLDSVQLEWRDAFDEYNLAVANIVANLEARVAKIEEARLKEIGAYVKELDN